MSPIHNIFSFPVLTWSALVAILSACIFFFLSLRREIRALGKQVTEIDSGTAAKAMAHGTEMGQMRSRLDNLEQSRSPLLSWISQSPSVNLNRRGHVLRLYRRGDSIPEIASGLRLSQAEVKLIVKVHELSRSGPEPGNR
jgi:hypothetical protein